MTDNLALGPDAQLNHALAVLRAGDSGGEIAPETVLMPGIVLRADPALEVAGHWRSPPGRVLELEVTTRGEGAWMALHMGFQAHDLAGMGVIGIAARTAATAMQVIQPCLRSGTEDGFVDCFFDKHILSRPEAAAHLDALPVGQRPRLPDEAPWRELILFLPTRNFEWSLMDLRLFAV